MLLIYTKIHGKYIALISLYDLVVQHYKTPLLSKGQFDTVKSQLVVGFIVI